MLLSHGVPKSAGVKIFTVFKVIAMVGSIWLLFEFIEAFQGRTSFRNPLIDAFLTLPMFGFWFLVLASTM